MFKPKFRILERMDGQFEMQSKGIYTIFTWHSYGLVDTLEKVQEWINQEKFTIERRKQRKSDSKIKRIIEA